MLYRRAIFMFVLTAFLFAPSAAPGDDVDDLKAAFEQHIAAANRRDLDAFVAGWHDQFVTFGLTSPFPTVGKATARQVFQNIFTNNESFTLTPMNVQYRVIGNTGIIWGHAVATIKPKDGPIQSTFFRYNATYVKLVLNPLLSESQGEDGKWVMVTSHASPIQVGN